MTKPSTLTTSALTLILSHKGRGKKENDIGLSHQGGGNVEIASPSLRSGLRLTSFAMTGFTEYLLKNNTSKIFCQAKLTTGYRKF